MAGGASQPTKTLAENFAGKYLEVQVDDLKTLKSNGWRTDRPTEFSVAATGGWSPSSLELTACEDATKVRLLDESNKEVAEDRPRRFVQTLTATKVDGRWKITGLESQVVEAFDTEPGCQP
jgi:hypothetical protein